MLRPHALTTIAIAITACGAPPEEAHVPDVPTPPVAPAPLAAPPALAIVDTPIPFADDRQALTLAYLRAHVDPDAASIEIVPHVVVLHWTGGPTFESAFQTFSPSTLADSRPELAGASDLNVSSQFLVDRDGTVHRLMPETWMARHAIGLNWTAIGVENVGGGPDWPLTDAQVEADAALVRYLAAKYPIEVLIGHDEYRTLEGSPYFRELDAGYRTAKDDPGPEFMAKVRDRVADLALKGSN